MIHDPFKDKRANDSASAVNQNGNITGTHTDAALMESVLQSIRATDAALRTGILCDACDLPRARASVLLRYDDAPTVRAALCPDCLLQAREEKAIRVSECESCLMRQTVIADEIISEILRDEAQAMPDSAEMPKSQPDSQQTPAMPVSEIVRQADIETIAQAATLPAMTGAETFEDVRRETSAGRNADAPVIENVSHPSVMFQARVDCELCDNVATLRRKFAGSMTNVCDKCAQDIAHGKA